MKKIFKFLIIASFACFGLNSCSDDDDTVSTNVIKGDYFYMHALSNWNYTTYDYDYNSDSTIIESTLRYDSLAVTGSSTLNGKSAYTMSWFTTNANGAYEKKSDFAFSVGDNKLYVTSNFLDFKNKLNIALDYTYPADQWILLADADATKSWNAFADSIDITEQTINFPNYGDIKLKGKYNIVITKKDDTSDSLFNGKVVNSLNFEVKHVYKGTADFSTLGYPENIPFEMNIKTVYSFGAEVGLRRISSDNQKINISFLGSNPFIQEIAGFKSIINSYNNPIIVPTK